MATKVLILDALQLRYVRRRRGASGACIETYHNIGFAEEEEIRRNQATSQLYRSIHWAGENWLRVEYVLSGDGNWSIPDPRHPDCLVTREPREGEIFHAETALLWLAPGRCEVLTGTLAERVFEEKHGDVVGDLKEYLDHIVFEECLNLLTAEYSHEIEGQVGRFIVDELARAVRSETLTGADEEITEEIASAVHGRIVEFVDSRLNNLIVDVD